MDLFYAFVILMLAGGAIAYFGDRLGYTMGKKRVTVFGWRPRHTATACRRPGAWIVAVHR